jgi:mono/diheme cytochrome c family protein
MVAVLAAALAACGVGRPPADAGGAEIYRLLCANCHGVDLEGRLAPALGPGSLTDGQPDEFIVITVRHGRGRMPSFSSTLSDEQITRLVAYIREVQAGG